MAVEVKVIKKPGRTVAEQVYLPEIAKGITFAAGRFFKNTFGTKPNKEIATVRYPEEKIEYPERFRGVHRLTQRADGSPRCVACLCCSTACPAQCIYIEPGEYEPDDPRYGYERYPSVFTIDELRCIFCGMCEEACPVDAVELTSLFDLTGRSREEMIFDKEKLLSVYDQTKDAEPMRSVREQAEKSS